MASGGLFSRFPRLRSASASPLGSASRLGSFAGGGGAAERGAAEAAAPGAEFGLAAPRLRGARGAAPGAAGRLRGGGLRMVGSGLGG